MFKNATLINTQNKTIVLENKSKFNEIFSVVSNWQIESHQNQYDATASMSTIHDRNQRRKDPNTRLTCSNVDFYR